jgi:hypothetical protein
VPRSPDDHRNGLVVYLADYAGLPGWSGGHHREIIGNLPFGREIIMKASCMSMKTLWYTRDMLALFCWTIGDSGYLEASSIAEY